MADGTERSKFIDDEAEGSGSGHSDDDDENVEKVSGVSDDDDIEITEAELDSHRQLLNRLRRGNEPEPLKRTDSDQRRFLYSAHDDILAADSQPKQLDGGNCTNNQDYGWPPRGAKKPTTTTTTTVDLTDTDMPGCAIEDAERREQSSKHTNEYYAYLDSLRALSPDVDDLAKTLPASPVAPHCDPPTPTNVPLLDLSKSTTPSVVTDTILPNDTISNGTLHAGRFQLRHKMVALTYPQCSIPPGEMLAHLELLLTKYDVELLVAQEKHQNEGLHLHIYCTAQSAITTRDQRFFDYKNFHPNIQIIKNKVAWLKYCMKGGEGAWVASPGFDPSRIIGDSQKKKISVTSAVADIIMSGGSQMDVREKFPAFALLHTRAITDFENKVSRDKKIKANQKKWSTIVRFIGIDKGGFTNGRIAGWLNDHLLTPHKQRGLCLWIVGPTKSGKTSLINQLAELGLNILWVDLQSGFYDGIDDHTQLVVFDEFKAQKTITEMNKLCDGSYCTLNIKGSSYQIKKPLPVIVLSNFTIKDCYHNSDSGHLETLIGRFMMIEIQKDEHVTIQYMSIE